MGQLPFTRRREGRLSRKRATKIDPLKRLLLRAVELTRNEAEKALLRRLAKSPMCEGFCSDQASNRGERKPSAGVMKAKANKGQRKSGMRLHDRVRHIKKGKCK